MLTHLRTKAAFLNWLASRQTDLSSHDEALDLAFSLINDISTRGDTALLSAVQKYDKLTSVTSVDKLRIGGNLCEQAWNHLNPSLKEVLEFAAANIRTFHQKEMEHCQDWEHTQSSGVSFGRRVRPVSAAGLYVPGGNAPLVSSVLMTALPAKVAKVERVVMATPALAEVVLSIESDLTQFSLSTVAILAAAHLCDIDELWCIGGAQALVGMAVGTESLQAVDTLAGPGNKWVVGAKKALFGRVGIDSIAGPSEVVIIADEAADPHWVAADLASQAEHDADSTAMLITTSPNLLQAVDSELQRLVREQESSAGNGTQSPLKLALQAHGVGYLVPTLAEGVQAANGVAPEHLHLAVSEDQVDALLPAVDAAGAIFLGYGTPEVFGDYVAGPNHVLPTNSSARFSSGLGVENFLTKPTFLSVKGSAAGALANSASALANLEGLQMHALAANYRKKN